MSTPRVWTLPSEGVSPAGIAGYDEVTTQDEADALCDRLGHFFESHLHELQLEAGGFYRSTDCSLVGGTADVRLVIQSIRPQSSLELIGHRMLELREVGASEGIEYGRILVSYDPLTEFRSISLSLDTDQFVMRCRRLFYRLRPEWTGPAARLGFQIPQQHHAPGQVLGDGWVQCSECTEAFVWPVPALQTTRCPCCGTTIDRVDPLI